MIPSLRWMVRGSAVAAALLAAGAARADLRVDDFEAGGKTNLLGGAWIGYGDGTSTSSGFGLAAGHDSSNAGHFSFTLKSGPATPYVGIATYLRPDGSTAGIDLSAYQGIRFWMRGSGNFTFQVATSKTATEYNHWNTEIYPSADWQEVVVPFATLAAAGWGTAEPWDPTTVYDLQWTAQGAAGTSGELYLDDITVYAASPGASADGGTDAAGPVVYATPKVNQIGYLPAARKLFVIVATSAKPGDAFTVEDAATGTVVLSGTLGGPVIDDTASSGETVLLGDFSALTAPGRYVVVVNGKSSPPFDVGDHVYEGLFRASLRAFNLIRCGVAVDDAETGIAHAACHQQDAPLRADPSRALALVGGWHNAGDFGKWALMTAISAAHMMWAWELNPDGVATVSTGTADSSNAVPDLLDEARWGLSFLLELQQSDGSVIHKVDSEPNFAWGKAPEDDPNPRYASFVSTIDAAVATGALAQAARVFRAFDPSFADRCLAAAKLSWAWVQANPSVVGSDPYYVDSDPSQEVTWALGEMARTLNDDGLRTRFAALVAQGPLEAASWSRPELLGYLAVALDARADPALKSAIVSRFTGLGDSLATTVRATGYRVALTAADYAWESNETLLYRAAALLLASRLSGNDEYRLLAMEQLDWLLGKNPLDKCYVTGFGTRPVAHPYHWISYALGKDMPGWATGGPNQYASGADTPLRALQAAGTPPAKCYLDLASASGSYASNEGETSENAALVFVTAMAGSGPVVDGGVGQAGNPAKPATGGCSCDYAGARHPLALLLFAFGWAFVASLRCLRWPPR